MLQNVGIHSKPKRRIAAESKCSKRGDSLRKARHLPRDCVLVHHAARNTASHFRLCSLERCSSSFLVTGFASGFDFFDETTDAADACGVDFRTAVVATNALTGLRRVGHISCLSRVSVWPHRRGRNLLSLFESDSQRAPLQEVPSYRKARHIGRWVRIVKNSLTSGTPGNTMCCARLGRSA